MKTIKVVLVDDQILFIESLKTVLEALAEDIKIIGTAYNGKAALTLLDNEQPDIVLLDVRMPIMDGVQTVSVIHKKYPLIKVMMLTTFDDDCYVHEALEKGAMGYMLKDIPPADLITSIRAMMAGSIQIAPRVFNKLMYPERRKSSLVSEEEIHRLLDSLSKREREVLLLLADDLDNLTIAEKLYIAEQTAKNHISSIYTKLNIHDRTAVVRYARKLKDYF